MFKKGVQMISPTGKGIRNDSQGGGYYRASRGKRIHQGTDYLCTPGQAIRSPIDGELTRIAYPYKTKNYEGCVIVGNFMTIKMFYFKPFRDLVGQKVTKGDHIGTAQDISKKYSALMSPHIHLQIDLIDPSIFIKV